MDTVKKLFPYSFKERTVNQLVVSILLYVALGVACTVVGIVLRIIPFLGALVASILSTVVGVYTAAGIILLILNHFKVIE